jgi:tetratricopeptide (TPR) repeat protein
MVESERDDGHGMTKCGDRAFSVRWLERSRKVPLKRTIVILALVLLSACVSRTAQTPAPEAALDRRQVGDESALSERMAAEFARQAEDEPGRLRHLAKAAEASDDPSIAESALHAALTAADTAMAEAMLARLVKLAPDSAEPRAWAIALALHKGKSEEAWALTQSPAKPAIENRQLGRALAAVPVRERVLPYIERTIEASTDLTTALRWCAFVRRLGESDLALILVSRLIERFPRESAGWAWRAQLKREQKDADGAAADFAAALQLDPESRFLRLSLAQLEDEAGHSAAAARRVAAIQPADDLVVQAQVAYAARSEDPADLSAAYVALKALPEPRPALRLKLLGTVAELLGKREEAIAWLRSVADGPEQAEAWLRAAVLLNESEKYTEALELLHSLRGKGGSGRSELVSSYLIEGHILTQTESTEAARDLYSAGISLLPDEAQLFYARALEQANLGDTAAAEADLRQVLSLEPDNADAMNALGYTLADQTDRLQEALELVEKALKLKPDDGAILDSMGWVRFRMGQAAEAVGFLRAAHAKQQDVEIAAHLGEALWASNQRDEARKIWADARKRNPENPVLQDTLRRHGL